MRSMSSFARLRFRLHVCVDSMCVLLSCFGLFVCVRMIVLRLIVYALGFRTLHGCVFMLHVCVY